MKIRPLLRVLWANQDLLSCPLLLTSLLLSTSLTLKPCLTFFCMVPRIFPSMPILISSMLLLLSSAPQSDLRSSKLFRGCKRVLLEVVLKTFVTTASYSNLIFRVEGYSLIHDGYPHIPFTLFIRCFVLLCFTASSITLTLPRSDRYRMSFRDTAVSGPRIISLTGLSCYIVVCVFCPVFVYVCNL